MTIFSISSDLLGQFALNVCADERRPAACPLRNAPEGKLRAPLLQ